MVDNCRGKCCSHRTRGGACHRIPRLVKALAGVGCVPSTHSVDRRTAAPEPLWRPGAGVLRRRHDRRDDCQLGENRGAASDFTDLGDALQGDSQVSAGDRARTENSCNDRCSFRG